jgi:hypothetical protein
VIVLLSFVCPAPALLRAYVVTAEPVVPLEH